MTTQTDAIPPKPRRSVGAQRSQDSTDAILTAAAEILEEDGYGKFSIEKVARRARAGKPTIYRWWPSKAALLLDVYMRKKSVHCPDTGDIEADLACFITEVFRVWRETQAGEIFGSMIAEAQSDPEAQRVLSTYAAERRARFAGLIARAQERGQIAAEVEGEVVADWIAGWMWCHLLTGRLNATVEETEQAVRVLTKGMLTKE